jgi:hypothetical protein
VNEVLARAGAFFVAPPMHAAARTAATAVPPPAPARAGILAAEGDLPAASGMLAAALRARHRASAAVVCLPFPGRGGAPATPGAGALGRRLAWRELECSAVGSLCRVHLPADPREFVVAAWRVLGAVDVPAVVAVPRREAAFDDLLAELDLLALTPGRDADPVLTDVAAASLERLGPPVARVALPQGSLARHAAAAGLLRAPLAQPVPA